MQKEEGKEPALKSDAFWNKVYLAVVVFTVVVIGALWAFSLYFGN